jgi:hypothetical protein
MGSNDHSSVQHSKQKPYGRITQWKPYELKKLKARSGPYEIFRYSFICIVVVKESRNSIFMKPVFVVV